MEHGKGFSPADSPVSRYWTQFKLPPEKRSKTGKAKGGRKAGHPTGGRAGARKRPPTSLLIAWVLAVILLSSLIYLGKETRRLPAPPADVPAQKAKNGPGSQTLNGAGEEPAKGPNRPPAARHSENRTESSSSPNYNPVEPPPVRDVPPLARDVPAAAPAPRPALPSPDISPKAARVSIVIDDLGPDGRDRQTVRLASFPRHFLSSAAPGAQPRNSGAGPPERPGSHSAPADGAPQPERKSRQGSVAAVDVRR